MTDKNKLLACPFCGRLYGKHYIKARNIRAVSTQKAHAPDCAVALNARHEGECGGNHGNM